MFRPTSPQLSLLESRFLVSPKKRERLERAWAEAFRTQVLPLIDEEAFRECFSADNGRPNTSIRLLVGLHLLKEADDLTDEQVLDALEFHLQWQHALGVNPADAHVCEKTLHNFRAKMLGNTRAMKVFEQLTAALMKADGLSAVRQRLDSTHVMSNIAVLTRLGLFTETVTHFLRDLRRDAPGKLVWIGDGYKERYLDREGYFADAKREEARRRLPMVAKDAYALVRLFEADEVVREWPSYLLLVRLVEEQCEVAGDPDPETPPVAPKDPREVGGDSLQSPHDPDATYGHKGKGYEAQLAETCVEENPYEVITAVASNGANVSDQHATVPIVEQLIENDRKPRPLRRHRLRRRGEHDRLCGARRAIGCSRAGCEQTGSYAPWRGASAAAGSNARPGMVPLQRDFQRGGGVPGWRGTHRPGRDRTGFPSPLSCLHLLRLPPCRPLPDSKAGGRRGTLPGLASCRGGDGHPSGGAAGATVQAGIQDEERDRVDQRRAEGASWGSKAPRSGRDPGVACDPPEGACPQRQTSGPASHQTAPHASGHASQYTGVDVMPSGIVRPSQEALQTLQDVSGPSRSLVCRQRRRPLSLRRDFSSPVGSTGRHAPERGFYRGLNVGGNGEMNVWGRPSAQPPASSASITAVIAS